MRSKVLGLFLLLLSGFVYAGQNGTQIIYKDDVEILPEITVKVSLSATDVNRLVCDEPITDVVYSKEKGVAVRIEGRNAFVKFLIRRSAYGEYQYANTPSELYVVCGGRVYTMVAIPKKIPARTIRLVKPRKLEKIKRNMEEFRDLPFEKKIVRVVKRILTDRIPESWTVINKGQKVKPVFANTDIFYRRLIRIEGTGLEAREYVIIYRGSEQKRIGEVDFLLPELAKRPIGVSLSSLILKKGKPVRLVIVERAEVQ